MATEAQRSAFGRMLRVARDTAGLSLRELATVINTSHTVVSQWERGEHAPQATRVPVLEEALSLPNGSLGRLLGYLPEGDEATAPPSVIEAIEVDPRLEHRDRAILAAVYRELIQARAEKAPTNDGGVSSIDGDAH